MSLAARLVHSLAIVTPVTGDPEDAAELDVYGHAVPDLPDIDLVKGLVQPRTTREVAASGQAGAEIADCTIYLLPRKLDAAAYLADADETGVLAGGRRWDITGIRSFEFGSEPHLEVDCRLVGSTEDPGYAS